MSVPKRFASCCAADARVRLNRVVVDDCRLVVLRRRVRLDQRRQLLRDVAELRDLVRRVARKPRRRRPVQHKRRDAGRRQVRHDGRLRLQPERGRVRALRQADVRVLERVDGRLDRLGRRDQLCAVGAVRLELVLVDRVAEEVAGLKVVGEPRVRLDLPHARRAAACAPDLDAVLHRADDRGDLKEREAGREAVLQRLDEDLLARGAVDVRVRMAIADVVERLLAVEHLVPGMEVDRCRPGVRSDVVAAVDLDIHAVQLVHEQLEPVEVDGDDVVDRQAGQVADGVERAFRAARRPGRVDPVGRARHVGAVAVDRDDEVARERQHRERVVRRVGADEHDGVRARARDAEALGAGARVIADDQRRRGLGRRRDRVEVLLRLHDALRVGADRVQRLVAVEVQAAAETRDDDEDRDERPAEHPGEETAGRTPRWIRLPVLVHRRRLDDDRWED